MGMFDTIRYKGRDFQTKDTPAQGLELYEIRDNELWFQKVEREWVSSSNSFVGGHFSPVSSEWIFCEDFDGRIDFYNNSEEYSATFVDGRIVKFTKIK